eukprot:TRINITY_DN37104_c0_g1_i1.p1 TRINITY_DN37104_c0_g1~~TRINITY_DN37104_c0_g1_i1.p1  ORF type:complete len:1146 (-),score=149.22 TRINITY_DN37104_c0_g1_i1:40-3435(-)
MLCGVVPQDVDDSVCAVEEYAQPALASDRAHSSEFRLTYKSLLSYAAHLAAILPRGCIALLCEGAAFATAFFSVIRSGRVALPLNPHDPPGRLRIILDDAQARAALVHGESRDLKEAFPDLEFFQVFEREADPSGCVGKSTDLCYLVYTSGSTGKPKGVAVEHGQLRLYCDALNSKTDLGKEARMLVGTAVNWDPCLSDVVRTFLVGGTCVFVERDRLLQDLHGQLSELRISHTFATPSWWSLLEGEVDVLGISAGEAFRPPLAKLVPRIMNMYGVTEGTVAQTLGPRGGSSHAGWTIDPAAVNVEICVDGEREGEIIMVGPMIARGYWGGTDFEGRFATRDRGLLDADGALHVLGRMDHQVKVRGNRVELGEVESAMRNIEDVRDAVAVLHGQSLVACCERLEPDDGDSWVLAPASWTSELAHSLPAAFRPAPLLVGRIPRLDNGKADRSSVSRIVAEFLDGRSGAGGAPMPGMESLMADLWVSVLPLSGGVGRDDNWFALGGSSLTAVHLLRLLPDALAKDGLRVDRSVAWCGLHRHPSLRAYAAFIEWATATPDASHAGAEQLDNQDPLVSAASRGDIDACRNLLQTVSPNGSWQPSHPCETPLHAASRRGFPEVVDLLLEAGAKLTAGSRGQILPLHVASQNGHCEVVARLLEARAPVDARDWNRWSAIFFAVTAYVPEVVEHLLSTSCGVNARDRWGRTALSWACSRGSAKIVERLLDAKAVAGARLQARQAEKWQTDWQPEAHHAVRHPECLGLLLNVGISSGTDLRGNSVLHAALEAENRESVKLLLNANCTPDASAIAYARTHNRLTWLNVEDDAVIEATVSQPQTLIFGIPAWNPAAVKKAVQRACGRARVHVASSGQGGVCLGTAVVELDVPGATLSLRGADGACAEVGLARPSERALADQAFPLAPLSLRSALLLEAPLPPPQAYELVCCLAALAAGAQPPAGASGTGEAGKHRAEERLAWSSWADWAQQSAAAAPVTVGLADPGALGLQLLYQASSGRPRLSVLRASDSWRQEAELLRAWNAAEFADQSSQACLIAGEASAADVVAESGGRCCAVLWARSWPWPEAPVELPCPGGALLVLTGALGDTAADVAVAWHSAQPWRESRSARKLWRGGVMAEG